MKIINASAAILLSAACLSFGCNETNRGELTSNAQPAPTAVKPIENPKTQNPSNEVERINVKDAKAAVDAGTAVIVDVRGTSSYKEKHIKNSIDMNDVEANYGKLPKDKKAIFYCS